MICWRFPVHWTKCVLVRVRPKTGTRMATKSSSTASTMRKSGNAKARRSADESMGEKFFIANQRAFEAGAAANSDTFLAVMSW